MKPFRPGWRSIPVLILLLLPMQAEAHSLGQQVGDFYWGFLHPMTALESAIPIMALGLFAGQQGASIARIILPAFTLGLLIGAAIGIMLPAPDFVLWVNLASFILIGLLLALEKNWPAGVAIALAAAIGCFQAWIQTMEITSQTAQGLFILGLLLGGYFCISVLAASALSWCKHGGWRALSLRVIGSWVAAIGLMVIALK